MKTAVGLSARFPVLSPAGWIAGRGNQKYQLVDGGYYENSGVATALEVMIAIDKLVDQDEVICRSNPTGVCNFPNLEYPVRAILLSFTFPPEPDRSRELDQAATSYGLGELLTPLQTLLNTRSARGRDAVIQARDLFRELRIRAQRPDVRAFIPRDERAREFSVRLINLRADIPLGWFLSKPSFHKIFAADDTTVAEFKDLKKAMSQELSLHR